ncbi:hypothetical protein ACLOJK_018091 [Asimina triloba]
MLSQLLKFKKKTNQLCSYFLNHDKAKKDASKAVISSEAPALPLPHSSTDKQLIDRMMVDSSDRPNRTDNLTVLNQPSNTDLTTSITRIELLSLLDLIKSLQRQLTQSQMDPTPFAFVVPPHPAIALTIVATSPAQLAPLAPS